MKRLLAVQVLAFPSSTKYRDVYTYIPLDKVQYNVKIKLDKWDKGNMINQFSISSI